MSRAVPSTYSISSSAYRSSPPTQSNPPPPPVPSTSKSSGKDDIEEGRNIARRQWKELKAYLERDGKGVFYETKFVAKAWEHLLIPKLVI
jgi:hypothetical protein